MMGCPKILQVQSSMNFALLEVNYAKILVMEVGRNFLVVLAVGFSKNLMILELNCYILVVFEGKKLLYPCCN